MICPNPILVRKGTDKEMYVPCGKCYYCRQNYRNMWITRLKAENLSSKDALFVTLTYDDEHLPFQEFYDTNTGEIFIKQYPNKKDFQKFIKRLRKDFNFRYFAVPEYGETSGRVHWHVLFFFPFYVDKFIYDKIDNQWHNGNVFFGNVEDASITYVTKYVLKSTKVPFGIHDDKLLCSRRPPIGYDIIMKFKDEAIKTENFVQISFAGYRATTPRLFRDKFRAAIDEDNHLTEITKLIRLRDEKLKQEFRNTNYKSFEDFLIWKIKTETKIRSINHKKHNKL